MVRPVPRWVTWYLLLAGFGILAIWAATLVSGLVPNIQPDDRVTWFHITAEIVTAALLLAAGFRSLRRSARRLSALALGALLYAVVGSAGLYLDTLGAELAVGAFGVLTVVTAVAAWTVLTS